MIWEKLLMRACKWARRRGASSNSLRIKPLHMTNQVIGSRVHVPAILVGFLGLGSCSVGSQCFHSHMNVPCHGLCVEESTEMSQCSHCIVIVLKLVLADGFVMPLVSCTPSLGVTCCVNCTFKGFLYFVCITLLILLSNCLCPIVSLSCFLLHSLDSGHGVLIFLCQFCHRVKKGQLLAACDENWSCCCCTSAVFLDCGFDHCLTGSDWSRAHPGTQQICSASLLQHLYFLWSFQFPTRLLCNMPFVLKMAVLNVFNRDALFLAPYHTIAPEIVLEFLLGPIVDANNVFISFVVYLACVRRFCGRECYGFSATWMIPTFIQCRRYCAFTICMLSFLVILVSESAVTHHEKHADALLWHINHWYLWHCMRACWHAFVRACLPLTTTLRHRRCLMSHVSWACKWSSVCSSPCVCQSVEITYQYYLLDLWWGFFWILCLYINLYLMFLIQSHRVSHQIMYTVCRVVQIMVAPVLVQMRHFLTSSVSDPTPMSSVSCYWCEDFLIELFGTKKLSSDGHFGPKRWK